MSFFATLLETDSSFLPCIIAVDKEVTGMIFPHLLSVTSGLMSWTVVVQGLCQAEQGWWEKRKVQGAQAA